MAKYRKQQNINSELIGYIRTSDGAGIPIAVDNTDYQEVLNWIGEGNTPDPDDTLAGRVAERAAQDALKDIKDAEIAALGSRAAMRAGVDDINSVPALRSLVLRLAEIIYSNHKGTID